MRRAVRLGLPLLLVAGLAGCIQLGGPVPGPVPECGPGEADHDVRVEVRNVDGDLSSVEFHLLRGDVQTESCAVLAHVATLPATGPDTARGNVSAVTDPEELWLRFDTGLMRLGTNLSVEGSGTLEVEASGVPGGSVDLRWDGEPAEVYWVEWHDDPTALAARQVDTGARPLRNATGELVLPVNSSRNAGVDVRFGVDVNGSRHPNWSAYGGPVEGVRVEAALHGPDGAAVARGNWTPEDGTPLEVLGHRPAAAGDWTLRYQVHQGEAASEDLLSWAEASVRYGAPRR